MFKLLMDTYTAWSADNASRLGAALAYYTVFSLAPLLIMVIAISGLVFGTQTAQTELFARIEMVVGVDSAQFIQSLIGSAQHAATAPQAAIIGAFTLLIGALGIFGQLQDAFNTIWKVQPQAGFKLGLVRLLKERLLSLVMVIGVGSLLLISIAVSVILSAVNNTLGMLLFPSSVPVLELLNELSAFALSLIAFALIFKYLPDIRIAWRPIWAGALLTACLFVLGKILIGWYIGYSGIASAYGAAGSLIALLVWIYYSAQILLFGAEFTKICAHTRQGGRLT